MFLIVNRHLIPKGYDGLAIFPFVLMKSKALQNNPVFINHERIHIRQQAELLVIPFYVLYVVEYFLRLMIYGDKRKAYTNISFEREAYENEKNPDYLKSRPFWNIIKYV